MSIPYDQFAFSSTNVPTGRHLPRCSPTRDALPAGGDFQHANALFVCSVSRFFSFVGFAANNDYRCIVVILRDLLTIARLLVPSTWLTPQV